MSTRSYRRLVVAVTCLLASAVVLSARQGKDVPQEPNWPREAERPDAPKPKAAPASLLPMLGEYEGPARADGSTPKLILLEQDGALMMTLDRGPVTAPGYDFHALRGRAGINQRIEWQRTLARIPVSLGRFGRSSVRLALAPWVQLTALDGRPDDNQSRGVYPSVGVGAVSLFDMLRVDVGRGLRNGRWTFALDVTRDLWPIL